MNKYLVTACLILAQLPAIAHLNFPFNNEIDLSLSMRSSAPENEKLYSCAIVAYSDYTPGYHYYNQLPSQKQAVVVRKPYQTSGQTMAEYQLIDGDQTYVMKVKKGPEKFKAFENGYIYFYKMSVKITKKQNTISEEISAPDLEEVIYDMQDGESYSDDIKIGQDGYYTRYLSFECN